MPRKKKEDSSFGPRLATLRKARGLTQVQLAEATKTTQRSISYYENGAMLGAMLDLKIRQSSGNSDFNAIITWPPFQLVPVSATDHGNFISSYNRKWHIYYK